MKTIPAASAPAVSAAFGDRDPRSLAVSPRAAEQFKSVHPTFPGLPGAGVRAHLAAAVAQGEVRVSAGGWFTFELHGYRTVVNPLATSITSHGRTRAQVSGRRRLAADEFALLKPEALTISPTVVAKIRAWDPTIVDDTAAVAAARRMIAEAIATGGAPAKPNRIGVGKFKREKQVLYVDCFGEAVYDFRTAPGFAVVRTLDEILAIGFDDLTMPSSGRREVERALGLVERPDAEFVRALVSEAFTSRSNYTRGGHGTHCVQHEGIQFRVSPDGTVLTSVMALDRFGAELPAAA